MTPKIIHLCWFSNDPFPVEIKICLESWKRVLPDFKVRRWTMEDARAIGCRYINEALDARKWAFAADVVRFYSVWKEGGVYMDSDMFVKKRFDRFMPEHGFVSFHEHICTTVKLQAAFFMGEKGNQFCKEAFDYYNSRPFRLPDGSYDLKISPDVMVEIARPKGYRNEDVEQHLADEDTEMKTWSSTWPTTWSSIPAISSRPATKTPSSTPTPSPSTRSTAAGSTINWDGGSNAS